jgi:sugar phosphate isomerase/epimerase
VTELKLALFTVTYCGLWYRGEALSLKEQIKKAKELGFDGITIETKRPVALPIDLGRSARKEITELAGSLGITIAAVETMSNFANPIIEHRENNLIMVKECIELANDLGAPIVKVFAAWRGTMRVEGIGWYPEEVVYVPSPTVLQQWSWCVEGIREASRWAEEYGITLALQNHPPVINYGYEDALQMVNEVGEDNVKLCLDVPLFDRQDDEYIKEAVERCRDLIVLSHYSSLHFDELPSGEIVQRPAAYLPGKPLVNYRAFIGELSKIGYKGFLSSEECSPVLEGHQHAGMDVVDRHVKAALRYMRQVLS